MATPHEDLRLRRWSPPTTEDPSVAEALERVLEAGQGLVVRQVELLLAKARKLVVQSLVAAAGILMMAGGWALLITGALQNLEVGMPRLLAFIAIGSAHLLLGIFVVYRALRAAEDIPG